MKYRVKYTFADELDADNYPIQITQERNFDSLELAKEWCKDFLAQEIVHEFNPEYSITVYDNTICTRYIIGIFPVTENLYHTEIQKEIESLAKSEANKIIKMKQQEKRNRIRNERIAKEEKEKQELLRLMKKFKCDYCNELTSNLHSASGIHMCDKCNKGVTK